MAKKKSLEIVIQLIDLDQIKFLWKEAEKMKVSKEFSPVQI